MKDSVCQLKLLQYVLWGKFPFQVQTPSKHGTATLDLAMLKNAGLKDVQHISHQILSRPLAHETGLLFMIPWSSHFFLLFHHYEFHRVFKPKQNTIPFTLPSFNTWTSNVTFQAAVVSTVLLYKIINLAIRLDHALNHLWLSIFSNSLNIIFIHCFPVKLVDSANFKTFSGTSGRTPPIAISCVSGRT